jgi:hypothetical protein
MKKRALFLGAAIALLLLSSCFMGSTILFLEKDTIGKPNLLLNPWFDGDVVEGSFMPEGWILMGASQENPEGASFDEVDFLTGSRSLKISKSDKYLMLVSESFRIDRYGGFFARASAKSDTETGPNLRLRFVAYNESGTIRNTFNTGMKTGKDWTKHTISAGFLKPDVHFGRVIILIPPTGEDTIWIDDIACFEVHRFTN